MTKKKKRGIKKGQNVWAKFQPRGSHGHFVKKMKKDFEKAL